MCKHGASHIGSDEVFTIEKGVPLPERRSATNKYHFKGMEVGDSFYLPAESFLSAARAAHAWGSRNGRKFESRKNEEGGRVWRVE